MLPATSSTCILNLRFFSSMASYDVTSTTASYDEASTMTYCNVEG